MLPLAHKLKFVVAKIYGKTITKIEFAINFKVVFFFSVNQQSIGTDRYSRFGYLFFTFLFLSLLYTLFFFCVVFFIWRRKNLFIPFFQKEEKENVTNTWNFQSSSMNTIWVKWSGHRRRRKNLMYTCFIWEMLTLKNLLESWNLFVMKNEWASQAFLCQNCH